MIQLAVFMIPFIFAFVLAGWMIKETENLWRDRS